jgi:pyruvate carboxylase
VPPFLIHTGFPHRGFPAALTQLVLKGNNSAQFTTRAGLVLPPVDFEKNLATLSAKHGVVSGVCMGC